MRAVLAGQPDPPRYFAQMKRINRDGPRVLGGPPAPPRLDSRAIDAALAAGAMVIDTRPARQFLAKAIPGTINIPANRAFTTWAGWLLPYDREFLLIVDEGSPHGVEALARALAGIGLDHLAGYAGADAIEQRPAGELQTIPGIGLGELDPGAHRGDRRAARCAKPRGMGRRAACRARSTFRSASWTSA